MRIENVFQSSQIDERNRHIRDIHRRSLAELRQHHQPFSTQNSTADNLLGW